MVFLFLTTLDQMRRTLIAFLWIVFYRVSYTQCWARKFINQIILKESNVPVPAPRHCSRLHFFISLQRKIKILLKKITNMFVLTKVWSLFTIYWFAELLNNVNQIHIVNMDPHVNMHVMSWARTVQIMISAFQSYALK